MPLQINITIYSTNYSPMSRYSLFEEMNLMNWIYIYTYMYTHRIADVISFALTKVTINATVYISFAYGTHFDIQYILISFTARLLQDKNIILWFYVFSLFALNCAKYFTQEWKEVEEDHYKFAEEKWRAKEKQRLIFVEIRRFIETFTALSHRFVAPFTLSFPLWQQREILTTLTYVFHLFIHSLALSLSLFYHLFSRESRIFIGHGQIRLRIYVTLERTNDKKEKSKLEPIKREREIKTWIYQNY